MRAAVVALFAAIAAFRPAHAQSGAEFYQQGIDAFRALEMEAAARMLRLSLDARDLPVADRPQALAYLGAAEFYRDRRDSSVAAFERLILLDPRYRLDRLAFAPEVVAAFGEVRRATPVVLVVPERRVMFEPGRGVLVTWLYPSTEHVVRVRIEDADGGAVRTLHDGSIADSARVTWNGSGRRGVRLRSGLYTLSVTSMDADGRAARVVDVPVRLERANQDSVLHPPPPRFLPERAPWGPGLLRLGLGVGAGSAAIVVVPAFTDQNGPRYAIAAVLVAAGVIGFLEKRPGKPYPDNVVANETARAAWEARVQRVIEENQRSRPGERLILETGRPAARAVRR